jgi:hypothetical protein
MHQGLREVTAGLTGDERVVVEGLLRARPGAVVAPAEVPMPALRVLTPSSSATTFPTTAPATTRRTAATATATAPTTAETGGRP